MIGLVTVLYKSDEVLEGFVKAVSIQTYKKYTLYLVDNSENEKTTILIKELLSKYHVTRHKHIKTGGNIGVAAGNNAGIKEAIDDLCTDIILLNNDIEIEQDFVFSKLVSIAQALHESIIIPNILYYNNKKVWAAGGYMDNWRALGVHYNEDNQSINELNSPKYVTYAPTCFMYIKKEVFEKIGLMDEKYFAYYDDTDFVFRACTKGYKIYYEPTLTILHKVSSSSGGDSSLFYIYYSNRNKIYFIRKNYKGARKYLSLLYVFLSRVFFYLQFNTERKAKLKQAVKDGIRMPIDNQIQ